MCNLMEIGERKWDEMVLTDIFNSRDVQLIKKIHLEMTDSHDSWF